jgi:16S rRNA (cytidine1402-2'-O)-methyltransferase
MAVLNDHTGAEKIATYLQRLKKGDDVALVSDAGTPVLSDPGAELVDAALDEGLEVEPIPGPSAVTASLSVSGFYGQRFAFLGFLPRKAGPARKVLAPFVESALTLVLFESPYRFRQTLEAVHQELGERRYAICRELTKLHEQVYRNTLPSLPSEAEVPAKGEFTLVIEGWRKPNADSRS